LHKKNIGQTILDETPKTVYDKPMNNKLVAFMLTFMLLLLPTFANSVGKTEAGESEPTYQVIEQSAMLYRSADASSEVLATLPFGALVTLVNALDANNYAQSALPHDNLLPYFHVSYPAETEDVQGWVVSTFVTIYRPTVIAIHLVANATVKGSALDIIPLYEKQNLNYVMHTLTLQGGTRVKIVGGYQANSDYTEIEFELNEARHILFVATNRIKPDGVSALTITALSILLACVTIAIYSFVYSYRKKR